MTLILRIENYDQLENGGPTMLQLDQHGASVGRRSSMNWVLPDPTKMISGHHFDIAYEDGTYWITDVSTNGTFVHGQRHRLDGRQPLRGGERFAVGHYIIVTEVYQPEPVQPPAPPQPEPAPPPGEMTDLWGSGTGLPGLSGGQGSQVQRPPSISSSGGTSGLQRPDGLSLPPRPSGTPSIQTPEFTWSSPDPLPAVDPPAPSQPSYAPPAPEPYQPPRPDPAPPPYTPPASAVPPTPTGYAPPSPEAVPPMPSDYAPPHVADSAPPEPAWSPPPVPQPAPAPIPRPVSQPDTAPPPMSPPTPSAIPMPMPEPSRPVTHAPQYPPSQPAPPPARGDASAAMAAFFEGARMDPALVNSVDPETLMRAVGQCLRTATDEIMQMLQSRADVKHFTRGGARTMLSATANNPLKFLPDSQQALEAMFVARRDGFMQGPDGFDDALKDIRHHQDAIFKALQPALAEVFSGLSPEEIEAASEGTGNLLSGGRKGKQWSVYVERWNEKEQAGEHGLLSAFLQAFANAYAQATRRGGGAG